MTRRRRHRRGFTLLEALLALMLALLLFGGLAAFGGNWLGAWTRIISDTSRRDNAAVVLDRIVGDLEEAMALPDATRPGPQALLFVGREEAVTFVRPALGFGPRAGLDLVLYQNGRSGGERAVVRIRRDRDGGGGEDLPLLRGDARIRFGYAGQDGIFAPEWPEGPVLPHFIAVELSGRSPRPWQRSATAVIRTRLPAVCAAEGRLDACLGRLGTDQR